MNSTSIICTAILFLFSFQAYAAGGSGGKSMKDGQFWFGAGKGEIEIKEPQDVMTMKTGLYAEIGGENMLLGPLGFVFSVNGALAAGDIDYNYTDGSGTNYTANDTNFLMSTATMSLGLKLRIINSSFFHLYVGGGGTWGAATFNYETTSTISSQGSNYQSVQKDIGLYGTYGEAGVDFIAGKEFGLRFAGRMAQTTTERVEALGKKHLDMDETYFFLNLIKSAN